ncbi:hypothetical protein TIFTF001_033738 [Ficus carica]|uniref:Bulb-type lectin domain-containing protein n=1 Tax=Ficus carica TaxID=3494 RepID=A0AA88J7J7_FICCA|nr:hypothetical protein TIFTF001_033738 [Ficus carica]
MNLQVFVMGFFQPGNSSNYYIGMWYKQVSPQTVVWVANRKKRVSDIFSSELRISDGNLVLFNESKIPIWSTDLNSTGSSASVRAVLHDSGNVVLNDESNSSEPSWQNFDHPAHTWLPDVKISYNKITKKQQRLTLWKNSENPAPGLFSLELDISDNSYILLWNMSRRYWTSGSWNGRTFSKPRFCP